MQISNPIIHSQNRDQTGEEIPPGAVRRCQRQRINIGTGVVNAEAIGAEAYHCNPPLWGWGRRQSRSKVGIGGIAVLVLSVWLLLLPPRWAAKRRRMMPSKDSSSSHLDSNAYRSVPTRRTTRTVSPLGCRDPPSVRSGRRACRIRGGAAVLPLGVSIGRWRGHDGVCDYDDYDDYDDGPWMVPDLSAPFIIIAAAAGCAAAMAVIARAAAAAALGPPPPPPAAR